MTNLARKTATSTDVALVTIDPQTAKKMLEGNTKNRTLKRGTVERYSGYLQNGEWVVNGETIKFSPEGRLLDGQHRLEAVVRSGVPMDTYVAYDLPDEVFKTIDTGKNRNGADALKMYGCSTYTTDKAAGLRIIGCLYSQKSTFEVDSFKISNTELIGLYDSLKGYDEEGNEAGKLSNCKRLVGGGVINALYFLFGKVDKQDRDDFFHQLETGAGLVTGSPVLALRERLTRERLVEKNRLLTRHKLAFFIYAWNAFRARKSIGSIRPKDLYMVEDIK